MFCLISTIRAQTGKHHDCSGKQCAWFDSKNKVCAVLTIGRTVMITAGRIHDMLENGVPVNQ